MAEGVFFGAGVVAISLGSVTWSVATGAIPARWPVKPIRRDENPDRFWFHIAGYCVAAGFGAGAIIGGLSQ